MSWLARIEEACAGFIERAFANMFPSDVEPAQIARKLVATMEARTQAGEVGAMSAPHRYGVYVHPSDYERLREHRAYLEKEWAELLDEVAGRVGILFAGAPEVELREADDTVQGAIEIGVLGDGAAAQRAPRTLLLRMVYGTPPDAVFPLFGKLRVGRGSENEIVLADPSVSRVHATIEVREGDVTLRDAGSTNGTFVNGERVESRGLRAGDRVAFGKTEMAVDLQQ